MSETKKDFLNMPTAFYVSGNYPSKERVNEFVEWLKAEGYQEVRHDYSNMFGTWYIDIASRTYVGAHSEAQLAPIVGRQGLNYDDFREIHNIFRRREAEERRRIYFEKNPTFEEWCEDVFFYIRHSSWYMKNRPDYSREEFDKDIEDASALGELKHCFRNREMPQQAAREWELIIF